MKEIKDMNQEELNTALYDKMRAEQNKFKEWLETQPLSEIWHNTYEFAIKEDILMALDDEPLSSAQARALLQSSSPLEDIFREWDKRLEAYMQDIRDTIEDRANDVLQREQEKAQAAMGDMSVIPLYMQTTDYAAKHNEKALCRDSLRANIACRNAIELSIAKNFSGNFLNTDKVIREVAPAFGMERLQFVLANMVRHKDWDGRISRENKEWAKTIPAPAEERLAIQFVAEKVHPVLLDALINVARKLEKGYLLAAPKEQDKPSIMDRLHQPKQPSKSTPKPTKKHQGPEL